MRFRARIDGRTAGFRFNAMRTSDGIITTRLKMNPRTWFEFVGRRPGARSDRTLAYCEKIAESNSDTGRVIRFE